MNKTRSSESARRLLRILLAFLTTASCLNGFGQAATTVASGNWDDPAIWSGGSVPNSTFAIITVSHTVNVRASVYPLATPLVVDQLVIGANGFTGNLIIDAGAYMNVANGTGTDVTFTGTPTIGTLDVSGTLVALTGITLTGNTTANFNFLPGSTYEHRHTTTATALPTATYSSTSTVLINGLTAGGNISSTSWQAALGNVTFNCPNLGAGVVDFGGHLSNIQGTLSIQNTGASGIFGLKATNASAGPSTINIGGQLNISGLSRFRVATTASNIVVNVGNDFTFAPSPGATASAQVTTGSAIINVSGKVTMTSGTWDFASGNNGVGTINVTGTDFDNTGGTVLTETGGAAANGNIRFSSATSTQQINIDPTAIGTGLINLHINNTSVTPDVTLLRALTVTALNLQAGSLDLNGQSLTVNGAVTQTSGTLDASSPSTLIFGGTGTFPGTALAIQASAQLALLRLNRASQTLITSTGYSVTTLDLLAGTFNNTVNTPQMSNGGTINRSATSAANTGVLSNAVGAAGTYSVSYTNNVALASGAELPSTTTVLQNLTKAGTNTLTVGKSITVNGDLTVSAGTFTLGNTFNLDLVGNFTNNATSNLGNTASTFTFQPGNVATATLSGATAPTFAGALVFNDNVSISGSFRVNGNLNVSTGIIVNASAGTSLFGGTTIATNNGSLNFNAFTILAGSTFTAPTGTMGVAANFTVTNGTSTFTHNNGTIQFNGTSALAGTGAKSFRNIIVPSTRTLTSAVALSVNGNISNDGTISFSAGTLTFPSAGTTVSGSGTTTFSTVSLSTGSSVALNSPVTTAALTLNGTAALSVNAALTTNGACTLNGTSTLTGSATTNHAAALAVTGTYTSTTTVNFTGATTITGAGAKTMRDVHITGTLTPNAIYTITRDLTLAGTGTLNAGNSTTTFNGTTSLTNAGSGTATFFNITISGGATLQANSNFSITGTAFTGTGDFTSTANTTFSRNGTTTITGAGTKSFTGVTINSTATVTPNAAYTVAGNMVINGILTAGNGTATFGGTTTITTTGTPTIAFNNLTINPASSLTAYSGVMTINGTFTNDGIYSHNNGTVTFAGNTTKDITSATPSSTTGFYNITVTNGTASPDVRIESGVDLFGVLTLAANAVLDADGPGNNRILTVRSTSDGPTTDGAIATIPAGASITGNVTVQRYMSIEGPNNSRIYRYISSPVQNAAVSDLQNEIPVSGTFTGASVCSGCTANPSMYWYNETVTTGGLNGGYTSYPVATNAETMATGRGYTVFVRGNANPVLAAGSARFDLRGPVNAGNINLNVTYTSTGVPANDGWNLVGNPYPATIDWNAAAWTKTNMGGTIYTTNNGVNPTQVATWNGAVGTNGGSRYIAMGQGFFVQATAGSPVLSATETVKVAGTQTTFFREAEPSNVLSIVLTNGTVNDEAVVYFNSSASPSFDFQLDAVKIKNLQNANSTTPFMNISTISEDNRRLAINAMPESFCASAVKIDVADVPAGSYQLSFSRFDSFDPATTILLTDRYTTPNTTVDVRLQPAYPFQVTTDTLSKGINRFHLSFGLPRLPSELTASATDICNREDAALEVYNSWPGLAYYVSIDTAIMSEVLTGTGSTIQLRLDGNLLQPGINIVTLTAKTTSCTPQSITTTVQVNVAEVPTALNTTDPQPVCPGETKLLTAQGVPSDGMYNWYSSADDVVPIASEHTGTFTTPVLWETIVYQVAVVNAAGCVGPRLNVEAVVTNLNAPIIMEDNLHNTLQSSYASGNRWFKDEAPLPDTTALIFTTGSGHYKLEVSEGSCVAYAEIDFIISVVAGVGDETAFTAYPNPVTDVLIVELPATYPGTTVAIISATGIEVGVVQLQLLDGRHRGEFDFTLHPAGIYILRTERGVVKVVKR
jgi:hypothetical protein